MGWLLKRSGSICGVMAVVLLLTNSATAQAGFEVVRASGPSPFSPGCNGAPPTDTGTLYPNAEVDPYLSVDPRNSEHIVGVWQQDRWSNGGSNGLLTAVSR